MVMFLHNPKGVDATQDGSLIELLIQKNRSGAQGTINLAWYPKCTTFVEHSIQGTISEPEKAEVAEDLQPISETALKNKAFVEETDVEEDEFQDIDDSDGDLEI